MLHPSTRKLIDRLAEMTELGKLDWAEGENGSLVYSTEGYSVCLPDGTGEVVIQSIDGKELERAAADALAATSSDDGVAYTQIVAGMSAEAARIARGTETAISSLLAGMEEPQAPEEDAVTDAVDDGPEDPGDEVAAMASEGIANHEPAPQPETESTPETEVAAETSASDDLETEAATESVVEAEIEADDADEPSAAIALADDDEPPVTEPDSVPEADLEAAPSSDAPADEIDTESDVTEAVARLADEVNNREDTTEPEVTSAVGAAAATAMGVVATAAGLDQPEEAEADQPAEAELDNSAADETLASAPVEPQATRSSYAPFGLDQDDEASAPVTAETAIEDSDAEPQEMPSEPEATVAATPEPVSAFAAESEPEAEPEVSEPADSEPPMIAATEDPVSEPATEPVSAMTMVEDEPQSEAEPEIEMVSEPDPEVESESAPATVALGESDEPESAAPASEPEPAFSAHEPAAPEDEPANSESEPDTEPVLAAPEEPKTYSLSGIGAGFGLGALAAKTEASGIPGPSSLVTPEPEKIIIDATEDVLPELEGNLNVEQMEAAVSEISFGKSDNSGADDAAESEEESEGDILKPRTRFNPWD